MAGKTLFWFRQDLRVSDNPGLWQAAQKGPVLAVYIHDEEHLKDFKLGTSSRWWLHNSLTALDKSLENNLHVYKGSAQIIIMRLIKEHALDAVYFNRCYEPWRQEQDAVIKAALEKKGIECKNFNSSLLWEPSEVLKGDGTPYKVFTPFYNNGCFKAGIPGIPLPAPKTISYIKDTSSFAAIAELGLIKNKESFEGIAQQWNSGEKAAQKRLNEFIKKDFVGYSEGRNFPAKNNTSRLSPYLHFGEISPKQVWHGVNCKAVKKTIPAVDRATFLKELAWREFSYSLLYNFPTLPRENFNKKFNGFSWQTNSSFLEAWQQGKTGYPIVDAGMRELLQTGYMHNRVRMIVGSFLVKNLLLHWHQGEDWFWDHLVDADLANNSASWQWVAGSGADAAPYFRVFNPITQGEKFDSNGEYTKRFVPELKKLPVKYLFKPWEAPQEVLKSAGVVLGKTYPHPMVDVSESRKRALDAYIKLSKG